MKDAKILESELHVASFSFLLTAVEFFEISECSFHRKRYFNMCFFLNPRGTEITCINADLHIREETAGEIPLISLKIKEHYLFTSSRYLCYY